MNISSSREHGDSKVNDTQNNHSNQEGGGEDYDYEENPSNQQNEDFEADNLEDENNSQNYENEGNDGNQERDAENGSEKFDDDDFSNADISYENNEVRDKNEHSEIDDDDDDERNDNDMNNDYGDEYDDEEYEDEEEELESLSPERKVRHRIFKFVNKLRKTYHLHEFEQDLIGNRVAMEYAKFLLTNKENETEFQKICQTRNFFGANKVSTFSVFVDVSSDNGTKRVKYNDYSFEFVDAHSCLVEFEQHRENLLSANFNAIGIGMAFDEEKVVVVDVFCNRDLIVDSVDINKELFSIVVVGRMLNELMGVYALRVVQEEAINKALILINPQYITQDLKNKQFRAYFNNAQKIFEDETRKIVEIYIRNKPETIKYGIPNPERVRVEDLVLANRVPLMNFPHPRIFKEHNAEELLQKKKEDDEERRRVEEKIKEKEERDKRMQKPDSAYENFSKGLDKVREVAEEEEDDKDDLPMDGKDKNNFENKKKQINDSMQKSKSSIEDNSEMQSDREDEFGKREGYEKQLERLEQNIEDLKRENEDIQRKIAIIYEYRKTENRDDRNYYKGSNINESTYTDSLTSAANLYNELNTHKRKLEADLSKYNQSIEIQEERKREVYKILMNYKEELISNAEYRKGTKIPKEKQEEWLAKEKMFEEEIRKLRIENIKYTLTLNRYNKELKKMEEYFEGLHLIDFEQLKIENNTLTEKIEDRNEEIHKLKNKINNNVQILAHLQEKLIYVNQECMAKEKGEKELTHSLKAKKEELNSIKSNLENNGIKNLQSGLKIDQINSTSLLDYYSKTNKNIEKYGEKIERIISKLNEYRDDNLDDILLLQNRTKKIMNEYQLLPKLKDK